ncbi:hypothetical protein C8R34_10344 [Nitrosomonas sp. Nm84]|nr:hypothetical protein C8R34_10344 [Nitrosomonas sp. Nm84]
MQLDSNQKVSAIPGAIHGHFSTGADKSELLSIYFLYGCTYFLMCSYK